MDVPVQVPAPPNPDPYQDPLAVAVVLEVVERGEQASTEGLLARAGVSEAEFQERYTTLEDCAVDAFERFVADYERRIGQAFNGQSGWRASLRAAAWETADWMEANPHLVSFGMTGVLRLESEIARVRREGVFRYCAGLIDRGRTEPGCQVGEDEPAAIFAVGSIIQLLTHRLQTGVPIDAHAMVPEMMFAVVRTYLGDEEARKELTIRERAATSLG